MHTMYLCRGMIQLGHSVTVITTGCASGKVHENIDGIEIYYANRTLSAKLSWQWWKESAKIFEQLYRKSKFDIVFSQGIAAYSLARDFGKRYRFPFVVRISPSHLQFAKLQLKLRFSPRVAYRLMKNLTFAFLCDRVCMKAADAVIVPSYVVKKEICLDYGVDENKICIVPNGIDLTIFSDNSQKVDYKASLRKKYGLEEDARVLLYVGRIEQGKGLDYAMHALYQLRKEFNHLYLLLVGPEIPRESQRLNKLSDRLGVTGNVVFCGSVPNEQLIQYYKGADVFFFPTLYESFGFVVIEAMASGIPVVASRVGAIPETVEHGVDGLLFPPGNVDAMVRMLKDALVRSDYAKLLSDNGYRKVTQGYTIEQMVKRVVDIFDAHLGNK